jgi:putative Mg2+ transporter-C (MgtC) family protein
MNVLLEELAHGLPDAREVARVTVRMVGAALLGGVVGIQRERVGKAAGVRTHMLVALGAALFVLAPLQFGMSASDVSRVIQGLTTGIGFIGAGAILKLVAEREIEGLTTAAGIWMTAAVGVAVGLGRLGSAILSVFLTWVILSVLGQLELRTGKEDKA